MQVTDIHYGESEEKDTNSTKLLNQLMKEVKPDMVALTGDALTGYEWDGKNQTFYYDHWRHWSGVFNDTKIPYAYTNGNHDTQADLNINEIMELDRTHEMAIAREQFHPDYPIDHLEMLQSHKFNFSQGNYFIRVYSSLEDENEKSPVSMILWFFDSGRDGCEELPEKESWGCITSVEVDW
eukprot:CAMPEP_0170519662 /NCGR_PEP_ID=MMETSP0209-20121228/5000_1 /TAXON_ID=665100 ORGANISM="Litonotus pictus, Strain P1" /NCGR_SAMPLE_ID=MMETSP0209 /ASSEMBLY_ACC=CAM_ASM_000301 /LENGTH=180 /DNA_ID=CAMNT_0010805609 /DNA_START=61 /DNA_END=600 /DNA_ORIENTATION=-